MDVSRVRRLLALTLPVLIAVAACGGDDDGNTSTSTSPDAGTATTAPAGAFPVTIEHAHGNTVIEQRPERIVTIGYSDQDYVLAFDTVPIAVTDWYGDYESATWPWASDRLGDTTPEVLNKGTFDGAANFNYEELTRLDPDLIIGLYIDVDDNAYDLLSAIAPTVVREAEYPDFGMPWQASTRLVGAALGQPERAEELIAEVDQAFVDAREAHPEFDGLTGLVAELFEPGTSFVRSPADPRTQILTSLGLVFPDDLRPLTGELDGAPVSDEEMTLLDRDVLVWNIGHEPGLRAEVEAKPLYSQLEVVKAGHSVFIEDPLVAGALTWGTVLSIPYAVESIVPQLAEALAS